MQVMIQASPQALTITSTLLIVKSLGNQDEPQREIKLYALSLLALETFVTMVLYTMPQLAHTKIH